MLTFVSFRVTMKTIQGFWNKDFGQNIEIIWDVKSIIQCAVLFKV
jgi:hypothetical protein